MGAPSGRAPHGSATAQRRGPAAGPAAGPARRSTAQTRVPAPLCPCDDRGWCSARGPTPPASAGARPGNRLRSGHRRCQGGVRVGRGRVAEGEGRQDGCAQGGRRGGRGGGSAGEAVRGGGCRASAGGGQARRARARQAAGAHRAADAPQRHRETLEPAEGVRLHRAARGRGVRPLLPHKRHLGRRSAAGRRPGALCPVLRRAQAKVLRGRGNGRRSGGRARGGGGGEQGRRKGGLRVAEAEAAARAGVTTTSRSILYQSGLCGLPIPPSPILLSVLLSHLPSSIHNRHEWPD
mmetsp:Transcript_6316/g.19505  ORF Transcript_6316/g.19505 Transcript_6316/m.19505 type:complete len:293 (+) Transcript_6316:168-1046(+)